MFAHLTQQYSESCLNHTDTQYTVNVSIVIDVTANSINAGTSLLTSKFSRQHSHEASRATLILWGLNVLVECMLTRNECCVYPECNEYLQYLNYI
jgi:hypothetical protein